MNSPIEGPLTSIEICAGAGGQAIGLHRAGFSHIALVEIDDHAADTLKANVRDQEDWAWERENCSVLHMDVNEFKPAKHLDKHPVQVRKLDLLAGGVPCPPFSHAGKQLGRDDDRDLFPRMLQLTEELKPRAVMIENVRGLMDPKFAEYRQWITSRFEGGPYVDEQGKPQRIAGKGIGYKVVEWGVLEAADFGTPQLRPRAILVAFRNDVIKDLKYEWPVPEENGRVSVAEALEATMRERFEPYFAGAEGQKARAAFDRWKEKAYKRDAELAGKGGGIAPTLVGGSKKHGGADLGPSRAKSAWKLLGVSGIGVANDPDICRAKQTEDRDLFRPDGPMLTVQQAAIIQGFPPEWEFQGGKTAQYRQVGNAFPPQVAKAVGESIAEVLIADRERNHQPLQV